MAGSPRNVGKGPAASFDYLVSAGNQSRCNGHAECIRGLEVDKKLEFRGLLYRKVARFCALEDFGDVLGRKPKEVGDICAIPHRLRVHFAAMVGAAMCSACLRYS